MWQRFTERARKVVFYAQEEAQRFGEGYVSTEHLLLGLVREWDSTAATMLDRMGVSPENIRAEVEKQLPRGDARPSQDMTLTPRAKRVIDLAYDEARSLNNNYIGTEHLLLGLIGEGDGLAGRVLAKLGVELEKARDLVIELQGGLVESRPVESDPDVLSRVESFLAGRHRLSDRQAGRALLVRQRRNLAEMVALLALTCERPAVPAIMKCLRLEPSAAVIALETALMSIETCERPDSVPTLDEVLSVAAEEATSLGDGLASEHLLLALVRVSRNFFAEIAEGAQVTLDDLRDAVRSAGQSAGPTEET